MKRSALVFLSILFIFSIFTAQAKAGSLLSVQRKIDQNKSNYSQTQVDLEKIKKDVASLSGSLFGTEAELNEANKKVSKVRKDLKKVEGDLAEKKDDLAYITKVRNQQIRTSYMKPAQSPMELIFTSSDFTGFANISIYQEKILGESELLIKIVNEEIIEVEKVKSQIVAIKKDLEKVAADISSRLASVRYQYYSASNQQSSLTNQLVQIEADLKNLSTQQKKLVAAKLAVSKRRQTIGDQVPTSEPLPNPGFSPAYVFLTYGYPHRVGMNQYGAYGRAKVGQSYKTILRAYYSGVSVGSYPAPSKIKVAGRGSISFENDYLRGISEMPRSWPMEALKAQAVAARTYALNWLQSHPGQSICTTQSCQVYRNSSSLRNCVGSYNKRWCNAVSATKGVVVTYGGSPITAWYASTAGGYTLSSQEVWGGARPYAKGIKDARGSWPAGAYDKSSPWFHTFWNGKQCSGAFPWLTKAEVSDLFNAALLSQKSSAYNKYLSQNPACPGRIAGWSKTKVISKLKSLGVKDVGNLSKMFICYDGKGHTSSVTFVSSKYRSGKMFSGNFFRSIFNLRSLGNLVILTSLYDVTIR